jgi:arylsulfatase A-like enzyme
LVPRLGIVKDLDVVEAIDAYRQIRRYALQSVCDPRLNLVFLHLNVPHPKFIYDAAKASFSSGQETTYPDNLALVDRILGEIREALEQSGTWDGTTILLTSDHPLRLLRWRLSNQFHGRTFDLRQGTRVPFLLKMAGQKQGLAYDTPMQTVVTKDLLLAIMKGEITQPGQVAGWLDRRPPCQ